MIHYWSYILAPFSLTGMWLAGRRRNYWGWLLSMSTQCLWLAYAINTEQWGFIPGTLGYLWIYWLSFRTWRADAKKEKNDMGAVQNELYRALRYWLETSLAQSDAEEAVETLDELVKAAQVDALRELADKLEEGPDKDGQRDLIVRLRKQATTLNCLDPELCTVQDPCPRCA